MLSPAPSSRTSTLRAPTGHPNDQRNVSFAVSPTATLPKSFHAGAALLSAGHGVLPDMLILACPRLVHTSSRACCAPSAFGTNRISTGQLPRAGIPEPHACHRRLKSAEP